MHFWGQVVVLAAITIEATQPVVVEVVEAASYLSRHDP